MLSGKLIPRVLTLVALLPQVVCGQSKLIPFTDANWINPAKFAGQLDSSISAMTADTNGNIYVEGGFTNAGTLRVNRIAKWNGSNWSALGSGFQGTGNGLYSGLISVNGGILYAGANFSFAGGVTASNFAKWDGNNWSALFDGTNNGVLLNSSVGVASGATDTRGRLCLGGRFSVFNGVPAQNMAQWTGTNWASLGSGCEGTVFSLLADKSGNVYAGGAFQYAGNVLANNIARWDGTNWYALGSGLSGYVEALAFDSSGTLYAETLTNRVYTPTMTISKWGGGSWSVVAGGLAVSSNSVVFTPGPGNSIYVAASFMSTNYTTTNNLLQWNGTNWNTLGSGVDGWVSSLVYDGNGHLYLGGTFANAGKTYSPFFAEAIVGTSTNAPTMSIASDGSGGLNLSWPLDHLGWRLQSQTNPPPNAGIGTNWFDVPGATNVTATNFAVAVANGSVYYRLVSP